MAVASDAVPAARRRLEITGIVQGVGFRPFVHGLAVRHGLGGHVRNTAAGVEVEVEGSPAALDAFATALVAEAPAAAALDGVVQTSVAPSGERRFAVATSAGGAGAPAIGPDLSTCADCLRELFDPADRRHRYPFLTCTNCGPRFTIVRALPYDRERTTLAGFPLCGDCRAEYEDPADRRFHAEAIACPACGPRLSMPLEEAVAVLRAGGILAVKGLGGWHLACDAADELAVARLRARKARDAKPFALMTGDPDALCRVSPDERALLQAPSRPIVLLERLAAAPVAPSVAPGARELGVMLPYTPLHHLLAHDFGGPLVMTSGNRGDEPIAVGDDEAHDRLRDIADAFLGHDRPIQRRCEDSVVRAAHPLRRSRGLAPAPLSLPLAAPEPLVAAGADLKSAFCVAVGARAFPSGHLGDLSSEAAVLAFGDDLRLYLEMLGIRPAVVAHDLHPEYRSTRWALEQEAELVGVQHHHAHAAACLAEHGETAPALAIVLDGTGYGTDGTLWGGELLRCDLADFERVAHLEPVPLPGGEAAIREPWRAAAAHLERAGRPVPWERWRLVRQSLAVNAPPSSGAGRLLDAVAALLGVREVISYEGQAAIELEQLAGDAEARAYPCRVAGGVIRGSDLVRAAHDDLRGGRPAAAIAAAVHEGLAAAFAAACAAAATPGDTVALSGGCLQNRRLARSLRRRLEAAGFRVLTHRRLPPNDGGIAYGQAAVAAARMRASCA
ncbi:MAG TPA: carbamoyltransferase HypF [Solirubrobacteraceae bacterium]|nr:carbamoyltransferase HypF [Solirubrobacteraceae bacterium]